MYRGNCPLHRAELMMLHGSWSDAVTVTQKACAYYVKGELYRLRGEFALAEDSYESANVNGCQPQPGLALLRLAQRRLDIAVAQLRRLLAETDEPIARARVLCPAAEILLAVGDLDGARAAADEWNDVAARLSSPLLAARAGLAAGSVLLSAGDAAAALTALRRASRDWCEFDAPYEEARTRVLIADACEVLGDHDGAELERRTARAGCRTNWPRSPSPHARLRC